MQRDASPGEPFERGRYADRDMATKQAVLRAILRVFGCTSLAALYAVVQPTSWMAATHEWIGLGEFPSEPIVAYLARSLSAFYALVGGLLLLFSTDLVRYRTVIVYVSSAFALLGVALFFIDRSAGLPTAWRLWEGPFVLALGLVMTWLATSIPRDGETSAGESS